MIGCMSGPAPIEVVNVRADSWHDVERLFGRGGASNGCWCQYWIRGAEYARRDRAQNQRDLARQISGGGLRVVFQSKKLSVNSLRYE
jgi:hypothetical protein